MTVTESENTRRNEAIRDWVLELLVVVLSVITLTNDVHGYAKPITWFILALFVLMAIGQSLAISKLSANRKKGSASSDTGTGAVASTSAPSAPSAPSAATSLRVAKLKRSVKTIDLEGKIGVGDWWRGAVLRCGTVHVRSGRGSVRCSPRHQLLVYGEQDTGHDQSPRREERVGHSSLRRAHSIAALGLS
jgi:hypothetical protein